MNQDHSIHQKTNPKVHLTVPEQAVCLIDDESPIDRYGPSLRGDSSQDLRLLRRSSCYSRNTDGDSIHDYEDTKGQEQGIYDNIEGISRPAPAHISVHSGRYTTRHGNESRLIVQGLSDPYRSGISSVSGQYQPEIAGRGAGSNPELTLQPVYPLRITKTPSPLPSPRTQNWRFEQSTTNLPRPNPRFARPSVPPIRPERWSAVSPSFRTPTSLVSPWKIPPSIVISSTSRLGQYSIGSNHPYGSSKKQEYPPKKDIVLIVLAVILATSCTALVCIPTP